MAVAVQRLQLEQEEEMPRTIRQPVRKSVSKTVNLPSATELPLIPEDQYEWAGEYNAALAGWWERVKAVLQFSVEESFQQLTQEQIEYIEDQMKNQG